MRKAFLKIFEHMVGIWLQSADNLVHAYGVRRLFARFIGIGGGNSAPQNTPQSGRRSKGGG
ncbi:hypothetical protein [Rhizobium freirei]|uniref:hypothetical protein n=1 Tax=Rhizobium freirei TaxID=1353277 RepID=UPI0003A58103|nr:hypothetical protein [Rhizobium freirei]